MPKLTVDGVGEFEVPAGKRLVLALEDEAKIDQLHACGGNARCTTCRVEFVTGEPDSMTVAESIKLAISRSAWARAGSLNNWSVKTMSSAVNSPPSCHFTFGRSFQVISIRNLGVDHVVICIISAERAASSKIGRIFGGGAVTFARLSVNKDRSGLGIRVTGRDRSVGE